MKHGFVKVAAVTPNVRVADVWYNCDEICSQMKTAEEEGAKIIVFPELCITGYSCGDLFMQEKLLTDTEINYKEIKENVNDYIKIKVETEKCPYYTAKMVKDVEIKESPEFIKKRLISAGMRPINNVVDISNYVMLEYGQPLHFFDKNKLGDNILVRQANENESIVTLDGQTRNLLTSDIVITDGKKPVCIAGVMGGENTDVDDNTKDIELIKIDDTKISVNFNIST